MESKKHCETKWKFLGSRENYAGGDFSQGKIFRGGIFRGGVFLDGGDFLDGGIFRGGNFMGMEGEIFIWGNFPGGWELSRWDFFRRVISSILGLGAFFDGGTS